MISGYNIIIAGLPTLRKYQNLGEDIRSSAAIAINTTTKRARDSAAVRIRQEVAFPANYLSKSQKRLEVSRIATTARLEGRVKGRGRPTSLATFSRSGTVNKAGVLVEVEPGRARRMKRAFLMRLPQGRVLTETKFNLGLAIRLKPGERIENKRAMAKVSAGLYLLYGPSVDQVFDDVALEMTDEIDYNFSQDFFRLLDL